jgi:hypothetical protein
MQKMLGRTKEDRNNDRMDKTASVKAIKEIRYENDKGRKMISPVMFDGSRANNYTRRKF